MKEDIPAWRDGRVIPFTTSDLGVLHLSDKHFPREILKEMQGTPLAHFVYFHYSFGMQLHLFRNAFQAISFTPTWMENILNLSPLLMRSGRRKKCVQFAAIAS